MDKSRVLTHGCHCKRRLMQNLRRCGGYKNVFNIFIRF